MSAEDWVALAGLAGVLVLLFNWPIVEVAWRRRRDEERDDGDSTRDDEQE